MAVEATFAPEIEGSILSVLYSEFATCIQKVIDITKVCLRYWNNLYFVILGWMKELSRPGPRLYEVRSNKAGVIEMSPVERAIPELGSF